jgi:FkbM family methyltransferase
MGTSAQSSPYGALAPGRLDRAVLALTASLPDNWLGLRLAILLRRIVTMRLEAGVLDVERWGLKLRLHPRDNGCEKNLLFTPQMFEPVERANLAGEVARAQPTGRPFVLVDIGVNVGLFSLFVASRTGVQARILAVEPEPGNLERLRFSLASNPGLPIVAFPLALGEEEGELTVALDPCDRGGRRTFKPGKAPLGAVTVRVACRPLLLLLRDQAIEAIDALKIDVEGFEDKVLAPFFRDALAALWPRLIVIEDARHHWAVDLFALMAKKGYRIAARTKLNVMLRR